MQIKRRNLGLLVFLVLTGCATLFSKGYLDVLYGPVNPLEREVAILDEKSVDYWADVQPILDNRCVVCHGCYDAPCQLKLTAPEGLVRGASHDLVYNQSRFGPADLTRLFEDAFTVEEWRAKGFFPVLNERSQTLEAHRGASVLYQTLLLKENNPLPTTARLSEKDFTLGIDRAAVCPTPEAWSSFADGNPLWGMPYALPGLSTSERETLKRWLDEGARYTPRDTLSREVLTLADQWEVFLNRGSLKGRLVNRYLYEHLYLANLYFEGQVESGFFKLVRSRTPPGQPIDLIATRRPYDDPGVTPFYYRLQPVQETLVIKSHMPYELSPLRMARWQHIFYERDYEVTSEVGYDPMVAGNPFDAFKELPVKSRYEFLLDEAHYTIMTYIKGPVCRGQVALNVIRDQFWAFFVNPNVYNDGHSDKFLKMNLDVLELPSVMGNVYRPLAAWRRYSNAEREFLKSKDEFLVDQLMAAGELGIELIWDGKDAFSGEYNDNAALTIFRHHDSATVEKGLLGSPPETAWLVGYALLERIYYLLVAGYDVYGNVGHQLMSRLHMDFLRMEGESGFLALLPNETREKERHHWYRDASKDVFDFLTWPRYEASFEPAIHYQTDEHKQELYRMLKDHLANAVSKRRSWDVFAEAGLSEVLAPLAGFHGESSDFLPEVSVIQLVHRDGDTRYMTLLLNKAHKHITTMFKEDQALIPAENTVSLLPGIVGSYPSSFLRVSESALPDFVEQLTAINSEEDYRVLLDGYGVRRTDPEFWSVSDQVHEGLYAESPVEFGRLDYNRLENR